MSDTQTAICVERLTKLYGRGGGALELDFEVTRGEAFPAHVGLHVGAVVRAYNTDTLLPPHTEHRK